MRRLTGIESFFVTAETPTNLLHVGALAVLDPSTRPPGSATPVEAVRRLIEDRIHLLAPFGRRLVAVPAGLDHPRWVEDPTFDVRRHVLAAALPAPGGPRELARYAGEVMGRPLDRDRPLWEIHVVEGLQDGLVAAIAKIHHAAIDGLTGIELTVNLMDPTPEVRDLRSSGDGEKEGPAPGAAGLLAAALAEAARRIPMALGAAAGVVRGVRLLERPKAPSTQAGGRITRHRSVATAILDREDVERVRAATGATFNDVVLAVTSGALRQHLADEALLPDASLVAFVPVARRDVRGPGHDESVNRLSGMLVPLGTTTGDPLERLAAVRAGAALAKAQEAVIGGGALFASVTELMVPFLGRAVSRTLGLAGRRAGWPPFNVVVSSFPGSPEPLYCGGSRLLAYYPLGPVVDGAPLNVTVTTYRDEVSFGLVACEDVLPGVEDLAGRIPEAARELLKAAVA